MSPARATSIRPFYQDRLTTIYHGECKKIIRQLSLAAIDCVVTDPPYGIKTATKYRSDGRGPRDFPAIRGDNKFFEPGFLLLFPKVIIFGANYFGARLPTTASWIIWDKREGPWHNYQADCEIAWTNLKGPARIFRHLWSGACRASERGEKRVHPTQKPVALMQYCIERCAPEGVVLDPYMGSGSTLLAARRLGIPAIGIDLAKPYCEAAVRRIRALEGQAS